MTVYLAVKQKTGTDPFGAPCFETHLEAVEDVIVSPASSENVATTEQLTGRKAVYVLGIPKDDKHQWEETWVEFFGRRWRTIGIPVEGINALIPLRWNKKVTVERYE